jgi:hypothetical protein
MDDIRLGIPFIAILLFLPLLYQIDQAFKIIISIIIIFVSFTLTNKAEDKQ